MSKLDYKVEDFVLDPEFKKWVLSPDSMSKSYWEDYLAQNPSKVQDIKLARKLLLNMARNSYKVSDSRIEQTWSQIEEGIGALENGGSHDNKVIPLDSYSTLKKHENGMPHYSKYDQLKRLVAILALTLLGAFLANYFFQQTPEPIAEKKVVYEEHYAPPGVKSNLTLQDGSKVTLNSGSTLRYIKNFEPGQRVLELEGEAYFEVAEDKNRPFKVRTGNITTQALGTSFNIKAYKNEEVDISLLTGLVEIDLDLEHPQKLKLVPGEALSVNIEKEKVQKKDFNRDKLLAWTQKTIIFDRTPIKEIIRVLENWYGVQIQFANSPKDDLVVSGKFKDQTLENVLKGLSYSARFDFTIKKDQVKITFN